jgi:tRNA threonylcarbamoyl adenosine modification protein (Sua5/YciO/YrdC/YwlC family)
VAIIYDLHPSNPQARLIKQAADLLHRGGISAIPTDSSYALVCHLDDKASTEKLRRIRRVDERHHLTLLCRDLTELGAFAQVNNVQYKLIKRAVPGPYTFILEATKEVPRRVHHPQRKTIGLRVPDHPITLALLEALGQPLLATTLILPGQTEPLNDPQEIARLLNNEIDAVIDAGACPAEPTTVIDLTQDMPNVVRMGRGSLEALGLVLS